MNEINVEVTGAKSQQQIPQTWTGTGKNLWDEVEFNAEALSRVQKELFKWKCLNF